MSDTTPVPWEYSSHAHGCAYHITSPEHGLVAIVGTPLGAQFNEANAEFITRACNSHAEMVKSVEALLQIPEVRQAAANWGPHELLAVREALVRTKP
jgi:hypothetical protein